jgi:hypothetical protein
MAPRIIVAVVALACGAACGILSTFANFEMIDKVNGKLPEPERFALLGWHLSKHQRLRRTYRRFYPEGPLVLRVRVLTVLMFACGFIAAWGLGLFAK